MKWLKREETAPQEAELMQLVDDVSTVPLFRISRCLALRQSNRARPCGEGWTFLFICWGEESGMEQGKGEVRNRVFG